MSTTSERLRKIDPKAFRYILVGADGEPITTNLHGKAVRWAFSSEPAANAMERRMLMWRRDARIDKGN